MSQGTGDSLGIRRAAGIGLAAIGIITIALLFVLGVGKPKDAEPSAASLTLTATALAPSTTPPPSAVTFTPAPPTDAPTPEKPRSSGETIIYQCKNGWDPETLCIADADGSISMDLTGLTGPNSHPAWSPDGTRILFASYRDGRGDIYVINADGTGLQNVSQNGVWSSEETVWSIVARATWSPDSRRIAFASMADGPAAIILMDVETHTTTELVVPSGQAICADLDWSPDGSFLASVCATTIAGRPQIRIWLLGTDGSQPQLISPADLYAVNPTWSPDGRTLAFTGRLTNADNSDPGGIYVMRRDGSGLLTVVENGQLPAWSPDGMRLVFERNKRLLTVKADGSDEEPMLVSAGGGTMPDWGKVAFWDVGDAFMGLYREQQKTGENLWSTLPTPEPTATPTPAPTNTPVTPNPRPKCADARACITSPRVGDAVTGIMPLIGSTNLSDFQYFKVEYRPYGESNWRWLMDGHSAVANGKIMDWHTRTVPRGTYEIRLTVVKRDGNYPEPCITRVRIY